MVDDATDDEPEVEPAVEEADDDTRPAIDEDETATFDVDAVDDIAEEVEAELDSDDQDEQEETDDANESEATTSGSAEQPTTSLSWGGLYVDTLATLLVVVAEEYGEDVSISEEEIHELASSGQIDLPSAVDALVADMRGPSQLPPEYAVLAGTALLAFAVLARETDVLADALGDMA